MRTAARPEVTVCIPSRRPQMVAEARASVLAQTYDASKIQLLISESPLWWQGKLTQLLCAAAGDWVIFLADDDALYPTYVEHTLAVARAAQAALVYTPRRNMGDLTHPFVNNVQVWEPLPWTEASFRRANPVGGATALIRKEALLSVGGFDESVAYWDWHAFARMFLAGQRGAICHDTEWRYRWHDDGAQTTMGAAAHRAAKSEFFRLFPQFTDANSQER